MQIKPTLLLLFLCLYISPARSQQKIDSSYTKYFEDTREIPFLHLNKTSFLKGEEIWFQAYVLEQNSKKLHPTTSNLYVGLYNEDGSLKQQQLIHVREGIGKGSIYIDSTFTKEQYYIKATTKWMQNFTEDNSFVQKVKIINTTVTQQSLSSASGYDFQAFPEGGHFLVGIENTMGVLIKNQNGEGVALNDIVLKDSDGKVIQSFSTNFLGLTKLSFNYEANKTYLLEGTLSNGEIIQRKLPKAQEIGVTLNLNNPNSSFISATLRTNEKSLPQLIGKTYTILIHNTSSFYKNSITFSKDNFSYALVIDDKNIFEGTNIITVFDEQQRPILERVFFNYTEKLFADVSLKSSLVENDSLRINLKNPSDEKIYLSASFLPGKTKAYKPKNNIYTSFLLRPYVKGEIENPDYYFKDTNRKKLYHLDLLLLTQGWSKYSWQDIFTAPKKKNYAFENGITITGRIPKKLGKRKRAYLISEENKELRQLFIQDTVFELKNTFFKKDSELKFGIANSSYVYKLNPTLSYPTPYRLDKLSNRWMDNQSFSNELEISNFDFLKNEGELLDGITITAVKDDATVDINPYGKETMLTGYKNEDFMASKGQTIWDFLKSKRMGAADRPQYGGLGRDESDSDLNFNNGIRYYLDGIEITLNKWVLNDLYWDNVKAVYIGAVPEGLLSRGQVYIYTYSPAEMAKKTNTYTILKAQQGFAKEKQYYEPIYPSYTEQTYQRYGALFWKPEISIGSESNFSLQIPKHYQKEVKVFIEGITESGKLVSSEVKMNTRK